MASNLLKGKVSLVTGASRGVGAAIAELFAQHGSKVLVTAEPAQEDNLQKVAASCSSNGEKAHVYACNLVDPKAINAMCEKILAEHGCVDVIVNNAGSYSPMDFSQGDNKGQGPFDGDPDEWDRVMMVNLMSALRITRWLGPKMAEKEAGFIINIASIEATIGYPSAPTYSATKWGLRGWSKGIFEGLKSKGIKCVTINPGQVSTPMTWNRPDADYIPELMIQPKEVAEAALLAFKLGDNVILDEITIQTARKPKIEKT